MTRSQTVAAKALGLSTGKATATKGTASGMLAESRKATAAEPAPTPVRPNLGGHKSKKQDG
jgi:hypothetical protein